MTTRQPMFKDFLEQAERIHQKRVNELDEQIFELGKENKLLGSALIALLIQSNRTLVAFDWPEITRTTEYELLIHQHPCEINDSSRTIVTLELVKKPNCLTPGKHLRYLDGEWWEKIKEPEA